MKALIGLTSQYSYRKTIRLTSLNSTYVEAVKKAGAIPIILPIVEDVEAIDRYLDTVQGVILTGGEDASPLLFGEEPIREVDTICFERDKMEIQLIRRALERKIPLLGICRGIQMINIALGGTLYQDIYKQVPNAIGHISAYSIGGGYHTIEIKKDSILYEIFKKEKLAVNSQHHQAIKDLGKNLRVNALSADGVIEGIESTDDNFILGVQFHPEAMIDRHKEFLNLFKYFISHCK